LQKQQGNLAAALQADKLIGEMKIKEQFKDEETEAMVNLKTNDLANKLDELKARRAKALKDHEREMENKK
jgi:hypothetical protein